MNLATVLPIPKTWLMTSAAPTLSPVYLHLVRSPFPELVLSCTVSPYIGPLGSQGVSTSESYVASGKK